MHRLVPLLLVLACCGRDSGPGAPAKDPVTLDLSRVRALVTTELAASRAATAADLVAGAPRRALVAAQIFPLPYSNGRSMIAVVGLAPGAPASLPVPTQLEYLRYTIVMADDGALAVTARPERADLVTAAQRALADEGRALDAAAAALTGAKVALPPGVKSWREAARSVTYDSRLPAVQFGGAGADPSWNLIFDPCSQDHGCTAVLLTGGLGVTMINGKRP